MKQAVLRKTLAGSWEEFSFPKKGRFYLVKNLSDSDILVSFEKNDIRENECFKIKAGATEKVSISYDAIDRDIYYVSKIYVKGTGDVEVQSLDTCQPILPRLALTIEPITSDEDLFGKKASDLQENIAIGEDSIEGKLFYVDDYTGFSSNPEEQHGNYIALKATANYPATIVFNGKNDVTLGDDGEIVIIVSKERPIKFTATTELETCEVTLSVDDLLLEPAPEPEEPVEEPAEPVEEEPAEEPSEAE